jgi:thioredoxin reductase (NADPH)
LIIGAGCAGASAGMYASRLNLKTAMIAEMPGGLITTTHLVENWPGIKSISGPDLAASMVDHAVTFGAELKNEKVLEIARTDISDEEAKAGKLPGFIVRTSSGQYLGKTILLATGSHHRRLGVTGEAEFENKGVSFCALCDGAFYRNKTVAVIGGGDSAAKEALLLAEHASKVYVISRTQLHPEPVNLVKVKENPKIELIGNAEVEEIWGEEKVKGLTLTNGNKLDVDGIFVAIGLLPESELADKLGVKLNELREIMINRNSETNIPGVYGAGDVCDSHFKQAITGSAEAVTASFWAYDYLQKHEVKLD